MTPDPGTLDRSDGPSLEYVAQGDPAGLPVLLLHGLSDSWHSFDLVLPHLPRSVRALALSQRGHGDSGRPEAGYRSQDYAADAVALMDALGVEAAVIVGHSMGSAVAQRIAIDHPERTRGLVLLGAFYSLPRSPVAHELLEVVSGLDDPVDPGFVREFQQSTLAKAVPPEFFETVVRESRKLPARVWRAAVADSLEDDFSGELGRIRAPTLLVWGDRDAMVSRDEQDALLSAIAGSRLVTYEGAGHGVHWEEPVRFASDLAAFVETTG